MGKIGLILGALVAIVVLSIFGGSFYTVDEGERAVVVSQGKIAGVSPAGFHWKKPFIDHANTISLRTRVVEFPEEPVYTGDRQTATVTFSVNYAAVSTDQEVASIYREFQTLEGLEDRLLKRDIKEAIKNVFGQFTAETAIRERGRLNNEVVKAIGTLGNGLIRIEGVNIENINFSDAVEQAAEDRAMAEMQANTKREEQKKAVIQNAIDVAAAQAAADSNLAKERARADGIRAVGEAEASAIKAKSDALAQSPNLVELTKAERWDGKLPTSFVPGSAIPFVNIK
ncbi:prohibitin family protein [Ensifer sp. ENS10]|uniref:SPFH domain-containing protein n=1 Tax=Ensifer sp. ENS10 TaxID=2769286 RepID=UPI0017821018|nr:prohibitin family protein [Ensifer sp. ENS10]MBD9511563.1 prohibitin family protein [Ensifer sp. ENS10]